MERIQEILNEQTLGTTSKEMNQQEYEQWKADNYNASVGNLNEKDDYNCDLCKNKGYVAKVVYSEIGGYYTNLLEQCKCNNARNAIRRLNKSGLKNVVRQYTFDKYETPEKWQEYIKTSAVKFCSDEENNWFFIGGQTGCGKSMICTAIAVHYIRNGMDCRYMLWRDDITKIKAIVNDAEQYEKAMNELKEIPVLYIDDMFKTGKGEDGRVKMPTTADINAAFEIINYRYNNPELITIISSERQIAEMYDIDEAIAGRITERTKSFGYCISVKNDRERNWRLKGLEEI